MDDGETPIDPALRELPYPFQRHLGVEMLGWEAGRARLRLPLAPFLMNRHGIVHGGVIASLLDTAMGYSGCFTGDPERARMCLTLSMTINYIGQAGGTELVAEARRSGGGRRIFYAEGEVRDDTGALLANASGVFRYKSEKQETGT